MVNQDLVAALTAEVERVGATRDAHSWYEWVLETQAGLLRLSVVAATMLQGADVLGRFDEPEKAVGLAGIHLSRGSKWNLHYYEVPVWQAAQNFRAHLEYITGKR
jgi:hypothetical protein